MTARLLIVALLCIAASACTSTCHHPFWYLQIGDPPLTEPGPPANG